MRRMTFISRCLLRMRPRDFRLRTTPAKWDWGERLRGRRTDSSSGPWGMGAWGMGARARQHSLDFTSGRGTTRHVSTVGNGFLRRRNVCCAVSWLQLLFQLPLPVTHCAALPLPHLAPGPRCDLTSRAVATENFADVFLWLKRVHNTTRAAAVRGQCCTTSQHTHTHTVTLQH